MDTLECLTTRSSIARLTEPAPNEAQLKQVLNAALNAPDHGRLRPWRLWIIEHAARQALGDCFVAALQQNAQDKATDINAAQIKKARTSPLRAPLIIAVGCKHVTGTKIPAIEQYLSTAALIQNIQLALHATGFGCIWRTGEWAYHPLVKQTFELGEADLLAGFLYIGTPEPNHTPSQRPALTLTDFVKKL